jgi:hypothetical protein
MRHNTIAIIQRWGTSRNYMYQRASFFGGSRRSIRNPGGRCLGAESNGNSNHRRVRWYDCTNHASQGWYLDRRGVHFPRYPLKDGIKFQIKTQYKSRRALFYAEHIGYHQYRLRIQNNNPYDNKQWWVFDWRSRSIRAAGNRRMAISLERNRWNWSGSYAAVVRQYRREEIQKIRWFNSNRRTIRDQGIRCLDVAGSDVHRRHVHFHRCHGGANQGWTYDRKGFNYPKYPLGNGVKFQIRSRMTGNKALYVAEHIGGHQYRLRIQAHDPENRNQWFVFDSRTNTIRPITRRSYSISNQRGYGFRINVAAVVRQYRGDTTEKIRWYSGSRRNLQNNGRKCLDVHGASNTHKRHVIFYNCHNNLNQAWYIDQRGGAFHRQPFRDGIRFQLRTKMGSARALYWQSHIGGNQYILRIRDHMPWCRKQWFVFDQRTRSIRADLKRTYSISNRQGYQFKIRQYAVIRKWIGESYQKLSYFPGSRRNLRNPSGKCLDVAGNSDSNNRHVIFFNCHNGANQGWTIDRKGLYFPRYPLRDGVKFQIKSSMKTNRALFYHEHIGSYQYRLRIQNNNPYNIKQWWVFDWRTKTIRAAGDRRHSIAVTKSGYYNFKRAWTAVVFHYNAKYRYSYLNLVRWYSGSRRNIRDFAGRCLDVVGASNTHHRHVQWYKCHNGLNQAWVIDRAGFRFPRFPIRSGAKFQIKSRMTTNRALWWAQHLGSSQYYLRIRDNFPGNKKQWFVFDGRTNSIRAFSNRNLAIANRLGYKWAPGHYAVVRPYRRDGYSGIRWYAGSRRNIQNNGRYCLDVQSGSNTDGRYVLFYKCHNGLNQAWILEQRGERSTTPPLNDNQRFQIRTKMTGGRAVTITEHIGGHQYRLRIKTYFPADIKQWFYFDRRTGTIRSQWRRNYAISNQRGQFQRLNRAVVVRQYVVNDMTQRLFYFRGSNRNLRNNGGHCMDVHGNHNHENRHIIFSSCHNGANQAWTLSTRGIHFPRYPLRSGQGFQIRSRMRYHRALFWHEHIGSHQYRLRIRNTNPGNNRQWFVFDWRTRTIRARADRNKAISIQQGGSNWFYYHYAAVVRPYRRESLQHIRWFNGARRNVRDQGVRCLDVHGNSNSNNRHVHWYKCHNGLNQAWYIDRRGIRYPKQPLASGVKFQIRNRMAFNRALYRAQHLGSNRFYLRIQDHNPDARTQWWTFDSRTQTIREFYRRRYVISTYYNDFRINQYVVSRQWTGKNTERIQWHNGSRRTIRNNGFKCLAIQSNYNVHGRYVVWVNCNNHPAQGWYIDQRWYSYARQPVRSGRKFQIRSRMSGARTLSIQEHIGGNQYRIRMVNHSPFNDNQWFFYDARTKSIRGFKRRNYALSNQNGYYHRHNYAVVLRPWYGSRSQNVYQRITFRGRYLVNHANLCVSAYGNRNSNRNYFRFELCRGRSGQQFFIDYAGVKFPRYPLRDGVRFQIKSIMRGNRAVFYHEHIGAHNYRLRIRNNAPEDIKQWWVFDYRTRSIRPQGNRRMVMAIQYNHNNWYYYGYAAVVSPYRNKPIQRIRWFGGSRRNIRDLGVRCLDVHGNSNTHNRHLIWYKCHNGKNQGWYIDQKGIHYPTYPLRDGVKFQIRTRIHGNRPLYFRHNSYVRVYDQNPYDKYTWYTFDSRTKTIRTYYWRNYALTANALSNGQYVFARVYSSGYRTRQLMRWMPRNNRNVQTIRNHCLSLRGNRDGHGEYAMFYNCNGGWHSQNWYVDQNPYVFRKQPFADNVRFQIRSRMASNRAIYHHYQHRGSHQYELRLRTTLPGEDRQWFVFDRRTHSVRAWTRRNYAISNQYGQRFIQNRYAYIRPWRNEHFQKLSYFGGRTNNFRNVAGYCLVSYGNANKNDARITFHVCSRRASQGWYLDRRPLHYRRYPLRDGIKFQIKSRMSGARALMWHEHIGSNQYRLRI